MGDSVWGLHVFAHFLLPSSPTRLDQSCYWCLGWLLRCMPFPEGHWMRHGPAMHACSCAITCGVTLIRLVSPPLNAVWLRTGFVLQRHSGNFVRVGRSQWLAIPHVSLPWHARISGSLASALRCTVFNPFVRLWLYVISLGPSVTSRSRAQAWSLSLASGDFSPHKSNIILVINLKF